MMRIPHCLGSRLTDGGRVVSRTHLSRSAPQKHNFYVSGTHFLGPSVAGRKDIEPATFRIVA
jgi:hypothetical protein